MCGKPWAFCVKHRDKNRPEIIPAANASAAKFIIFNLLG